MKVLIGSAWPYANGSLHIGHLAGLLPSDVIARYHRLKGDDVYFVSGSDCFGTPIVIRAKQEHKTPDEISEYYHKEFCDCFDKLGFSYDMYGKTNSSSHINFVLNFHEKMYKNSYVTEKKLPQAFCDNCNEFLADRFVNGICPICGEKARGDQCDFCGTILDPEQLHDPRCSICNSTPTFKDTTHLFIEITKLEKELRQFVDSHPEWRKNAISFTNRYINEGLCDRAITRSLNWGVPVPKEGYSDKKIYIWAENVLGYLSQSFELCQKRGEDFNSLWGANAKHYYVHGKDNIPFHTIILPALLLANGEYTHLPDVIVSSEYLTLEGQKISTSKNWAIWLKDLLEKYDPDSLRFYFITNGPERKDADFSWDNYFISHNSELLGTYGNFVNRNLAFVQKYLGGIIPNGELEPKIKNLIEETFKNAGENIEKGNLRDATFDILELVRFGNKYFDSTTPWITRESNIEECKHTIYNCVQIILNLSVLFSPFIPFSSKKLQTWLNADTKWAPQYKYCEFELPQIEILFNRLDKSIIEEERNKLSL